MITKLTNWRTIDHALRVADACISSNYGDRLVNGRRMRAEEDFKAKKVDYHGIVTEGKTAGYLRIIPQGNDAFIDYLLPLTEAHVHEAKAWAQQQGYEHVYINARHKAVHYALPDNELHLIPVDLENRPQVTSDTPRNGKHYAVLDLKE